MNLAGNANSDVMVLVVISAVHSPESDVAVVDELIDLVAEEVVVPPDARVWVWSTSPAQEALKPIDGTCSTDSLVSRTPLVVLMTHVSPSFM